MIRRSTRPHLKSYEFENPVFVPNVLLKGTQQTRSAVVDLWVYSVVVLDSKYGWHRSYFAYVPSHNNVIAQGSYYSPLPNEKLHLADWALAAGETIPLDWRHYP